ncbi:hypothetical protein GH714_043960 [Hevea brasiliensis]|uniref:Uncharacterized protein n=1 Tax=Hevea brasiliensis TaxID=3981 RepID=A0A6A6K147_HEVBR|nr:hypothetical protein GH714_043960 [Hevea brasiliensis]
MGSPLADARSARVPGHAVTARADVHDRCDGVSAGVSSARAWAAAAIRVGPRPEPIGGPACRRSTSDRGASPAPIRFPPDNFKHSLTLFSKSFSSFPRAVFPPDLGSRSEAFPRGRARGLGVPVADGRGGSVRGSSTTDSRGDHRRGLGFWAKPRARSAREARIRPRPPHGARGLGQRLRDTQADVPRPDGFGRNLRSKTRWFAGFLQFTPSIAFLLRSSSMREPRYPLPRVVMVLERGRRVRTGARSFSFHVPWRFSCHGTFVSTPTTRTVRHLHSSKQVQPTLLGPKTHGNNPPQGIENSPTLQATQPSYTAGNNTIKPCA